MKAMLHKIMSVTMALLLLASTTSWTVGKHYCMGRLMATSFFEHAEDCGMNGIGEADDALGFQLSNSCCSDEIVLVQGQDDLRMAFNDLSIDHPLLLNAWTDTYYYLFPEFKEGPVPHSQYPPPILVKDIQLLDEVFLI